MYDLVILFIIDFQNFLYYFFLFVYFIPRDESMSNDTKRFSWKGLPS
jgi:hypothetical protein